ncbi:MAG: 50S ribosomal protein L22 [Alphaproteobacteria bacterium]|nr:50S ribosomal protein L22 [Alphaproteobacteria bacterium]|tara:strand:- start:468 stop:965 length:498 start_codon:yes stop_codon:yes gene_type:complete
MAEENKINEDINKKDKKKNVVAENIKNENDFAKVYLKSIRVSPKKLNLIISPIRGLNVEKALNYLSFSQKRISYQIKKALQSAIANAENNHQLDVDKLYVHEASVGKGLVMKRFKPRAKGRGVRILKPFSNLTIKLKEKSDVKEINKKEKIKKEGKKSSNKEVNK